MDCCDLTDGVRMPSYAICPRALMREKLNGTELMLYLLVLDRCRLSALHEGWRDDRGRIWCVYPVRELAADLDRSEDTVKLGLRSLVARGLLRRQRQGQGKADRLFARIPREAPGAGLPEAEAARPPAPVLPSPPETEVFPPQEGEILPPQKAEVFPPPEVGFPPPNKNYTVKATEQKQGSKRSVYGKYGNVLLTDAEYTDLALRLPDLGDRIRCASIHMHYGDILYPDHAALLRDWPESIRTG